MATTIRRVEPAQNEFLAGLEKQANRSDTFFRILANRPEVLKSFVPLYDSIMGPGSIDRRTKELIYLATSYANESRYCTAAHSELGKKAGISEEEMRALQTEQDHGFSGPERAAIQFARELTRTAAAEESVEGLYEHFSDEQIVEITLVAGLANFTNRFSNGLSLEAES